MNRARLESIPDKKVTSSIPLSELLRLEKKIRVRQFRLDTTSIQSHISLISCLHYINLDFKNAPPFHFLPLNSYGFLPKRLNEKEFLLSEQIKNIYMPPNGLVFSQSPLYQDVSHFENLMVTCNNSFS